MRGTHEKHGGFIRYCVDAEHVNLSTFFQHMEENKNPLGILDYSICQGSLEQVFIKFASDHPRKDRLATKMLLLC